MKPPPFLMGAAILFWGWRSGLFVWAAIMAVILELAHFVDTHWEFSESEFKRVWDLCMLMVVGEVVILLSAEDRVWGQLSFKFFQWLPVPLFPMMLAQVYGSFDRIPLSVFSTILRRLPQAMLANKSINISWIYYVICLVGASATQRQNPWFYPGIVSLTMIALYKLKPRRATVATWLLLSGLVTVSGFAAEQAIFLAQNQLEANLIRWISTFFVRTFNMRESQTAIGQLGRIKLSGKIIWRVTPDPNSPPPMLLREAAFNVYGAGVWRSVSNELSSVVVDVNESVVLLPHKKNESSAHIAGYIDRGRGLLALPHGTVEIHDLAATLATNGMGVARIEDAPEFVNYQVVYAPGASMDSHPNDLDLDVPSAEVPILQAIIDELQLAEKSTQEKIRAIREFLNSKFTYSMEIGPQHLDRTGRKTPLGQFLTTTRSGHCEYFATATVLLLRQAGVPARYVIGYGVEERSGSTYVVRERHGHAWTLVYRSETRHWEELDTTPSSWSELENKRATTWESISDFFSQLKFQFSKWRYSKTSYVAYLRWLLIPLVLVLAWRIAFQKRRKHNKANGQSAAAAAWPGLDSEFYLIEQTLSKAGMARLPNEAPGVWLGRVAVPRQEVLGHIVTLHHRLRFDPKSLSPEERQRLASQSRQWITEFEAQRKA